MAGKSGEPTENIDIASVLDEVTKPLRANGARYMLVGALAVFIHGTPRTTRDLDIVVDVKSIAPAQLERVLRATGYELEGPDQTEFGRRLRLYHPAFPVEFFLVGGHPYHDEEFARAAPFPFGAVEHLVLSAEDLLLRKLRNTWIRRSTKDVEDIKAIIAKNRDSLDIEAFRGRARFYRVLERFDDLWKADAERRAQDA